MSGCGKSLADLALRHGSELKKLYILLNRHPESSERLLHLMSIPVFVRLIRESDLSNETEKAAGGSGLLLMTQNLKNLANIWNSYINCSILQKSGISQDTIIFL